MTPFGSSGHPDTEALWPASSSRKSSERSLIASTRSSPSANASANSTDTLHSLVVTSSPATQSPACGDRTLPFSLPHALLDVLVQGKLFSLFLSRDLIRRPLPKKLANT